MTTPVPLTTSLGAAQQWLRQRVDDGERCPCCHQFAKVYKRKINSTMARALIQFHRNGLPGEFLHGPSLPGDTHECSQLVWWGLLEEEKLSRPDGGRAGWWRLTPLGRLFVEDNVRLYKYARIYDGRCLGLMGDLVGIKEALGDKFDLAELMSQ